MAGCLPLLVAAASFGAAPHLAAGHPLPTLLDAFGTLTSSGTLNPLLLYPGFQLDFPPSPPALGPHFFDNLQSTAAAGYLNL